jgi:cell division protein FtsN
MEVSLGTDPLQAGKAAHAVRSAGLDAVVVAPESSDSDRDCNTPAESTSALTAPDTPSAHHFRVQLGAYKTPDQAGLDALFAGLDVLRFKGEDGLTRVVSGAFDRRLEAVEFKVRMVTLGFSGAFVTSHIPGEGNSAVVGSGGATTSEMELQPQFDRTKIGFRIQLGALKSRMSVEAMNGLLEIGDVEHRSNTGWHRYLHGQFQTVEAARAALPNIQSSGFPDAFVVGDVSGRIVPLAEAEILLSQD